MPDFETAKFYWARASSAVIEFEHGVSDALILLSAKQQVRLLLQILKGFKSHIGMYQDEWYYRTPKEKADYEQMDKLFDEFSRYEMLGTELNRTLSEKESMLLRLKLVSDQFWMAQFEILEAYEDREGEENAIKWILDRREYIKMNSEWRAAERERKGLPPDTRTTAEKILDSFTDPDFIEPDASEDSASADKAMSALGWRFTLSSFAEMLYRLEKRGAIDLGSYFDQGGRGTDLARSVCRLFAFNSPSGNEAITLNTYISEIKKDLGPGDPSQLVLKALGRSRGKKIDDVIPDMA